MLRRSSHTPTRREFLYALALSALGTLAAGASSVAYARYVEPYWPQLERIRVPLARLPTAWRGLRILQLSDFHLGRLVSAEDIAPALRLTHRVAPDLICLTGDFITADADHLQPLTPLLEQLHAPLGVYAVLGNHDYWSSVGVVIEQLQAAGVRVLRNEAVRLEQANVPLWLLGVDDVWENQQDLATTRANIPPDECQIALVHEPDYADEVAATGVDLQLSGHSHGGQIRLPGIGALVLPRWARKYPIGLQRVGTMWIYTNRGLGVIYPPIRFNCRPEVTLLTLAPVDDKPSMLR